MKSCGWFRHKYKSEIQTLHNHLFCNAYPWTPTRTVETCGKCGKKKVTPHHLMELHNPVYYNESLDWR